MAKFIEGPVNHTEVKAEGGEIVTKKEKATTEVAHNASPDNYQFITDNTSRAKRKKICKQARKTAHSPVANLKRSVTKQINNTLESLENLNISEACFQDIMSLIDEKLTDVVNRAIANGKLPPFKKGTKLSSYWYKKNKEDKIVPGDTTAELYVKAEKVTPSKDKTSDKQTNRILNNTPWGASDELASKLHGIKLHKKGEKDLINDKRLMDVAQEKSEERNKKKLSEDYNSYKEQQEEKGVFGKTPEERSQAYKDLATVQKSIRRDKTKALKNAYKEHRKSRKEELAARGESYHVYSKKYEKAMKDLANLKKRREEEGDAERDVQNTLDKAQKEED